MFRLLIFIVGFFYLTNTCFAQIHDTAWTKEIILPESQLIDSSNRILLFETDTFSVYSRLEVVVTSIREHIKNFEVEDDTELLNNLLDPSNSLRLNLDAINNNIVLKSRLNFRIVELIQERKCLVYNKIEESLETVVFVTDYIQNWWTGIRISTQTNQVIIDVRTGAF